MAIYPIILPVQPIEPYSTPQDEQDLEINPATGELDLVTDFNTDRILTSDYTQTGQKRITYDILSNSWIEDDPTIVIDNRGNVVKV